MQNLENYSHDSLLDGTFLVQGVLILCYLISAFVVSSNAYAGFNGVFLGIVYAVILAASYRGLRKDVTRTMYGALLGSCCMLVMMSLQSAIFWGQYSGCDTSRRLMEISERILTSVVCEHRYAMKSVCAFSVFMFLSYLFQIFLMIKFKNEILAAAPKEGYAPVPTNAPNDFRMPSSTPNPIVASSSGRYSFTHFFLTDISSFYLFP